MLTFSTAKYCEQQGLEMPTEAEKNYWWAAKANGCTEEELAELGYEFTLEEVRLYFEEQA